MYIVLGYNYADYSNHQIKLIHIIATTFTAVSHTSIKQGY